MSIALICFWPAGKSDIRLRPNGGCIARKTSDGVKKKTNGVKACFLYIFGLETKMLEREMAQDKM